MATTPLNATTVIATAGAHPPQVQRIGGWVLLGDVLDRRNPVIPDGESDTDWGYERKMVSRLWGRFIGVRFASRDRLDALLRDPSGAMDCVAWTQDGLTFAASAPPDWLIEALRPTWSINIGRVAAALRSPQLVPGDLLLDGPRSVGPGDVQPLPLDRPAVRLWEAATFARVSLDAPLTFEPAARRLRDAIQEAVEGLGGLSGVLAAEVSGGLDSSIVAAALVAAPGLKVQTWLNAYGATPESDERFWVEALAQRLNITPLRIAHASAPLSGETLVRTNGGFRPGLAALDAAHDLEWRRQIEAVEADALMTGKGGDSVLMQNTGGDVFTDLWMRCGWRTLLSREGRDQAIAVEKSLWTLAREARRFVREGAAPPTRDDSFLLHLEDTPAMAAWRRNSAAFGPAKAGQISGVIDNITRHGPSLLTEGVDVRHPLCAQPVVEACLSTPTALLVLQGRDRGLARHAFRDRLPPEILHRRSKGDMSRLYGKIILDNIDVLRDWLIHGRLVALGVIDPAGVDKLLQRETLIWRGRYAALLTAAAFEGWIRAWERRLAPPPPR
ncbi:asparagine synthase-related protein [Brevundimonas sp. DWR2-3-1b1]|uniref:asparagine synthase-related protein n=1 Tax=unclassified Brevundimonas TaxID=2622653 RepID=UPI003CFB4CCC